MQSVDLPWPSEKDMDQLVERSEGLFIYASTLLRYVGEALPHEKLEKALTGHRGVDEIYRQVLSNASQSGATELPVSASQPTNFQVVINATVLLHRPLSISELGKMLRLNSNQVRAAVSSYRSILAVPDLGQVLITVL
jgi:hypothetical protein